MFCKKYLKACAHSLIVVPYNFEIQAQQDEFIVLQNQ